MEVYNGGVESTQSIGGSGWLNKTTERVFEFVPDSDMVMLKFFSGEVSGVEVNLYLSKVEISIANSNHYSRIRGDKTYELSNHLGNVLATITDRKLGFSNNTSNNIASHYQAEVTSATDYYPFGSQMPDRSVSSDKARYGFQNQEKDNEIKGEGNSINYKYRMHDPRLGRFFAVDPLTAKYPHWSSYQFSGNQVISTVELEGLEPAEDLNVSANVSVSYSNGGFNFRAGATLGGTFTNDNLQGDGALSANVYYGGLGTPSMMSNRGKNQLGFDFSASLSGTYGGGNSEFNKPVYLGPILNPSANSTSYQNSFTYGQSLIYSSGLGKFQQNVIIGFSIGDFSVSSHNDAVFYGGFLDTDHGYTGGIRMTLSLDNNQSIEAGTEVYTGTPSFYDRKKGLKGSNQKSFQRTYSQGKDKNLNNGITFLKYNSNNLNYSVFSQGKGNLWLQRFIHEYLTNNAFLSEEQTDPTQFGGSVGVKK